MLIANNVETAQKEWAAANPEKVRANGTQAACPQGK